MASFTMPYKNISIFYSFLYYPLYSLSKQSRVKILKSKSKDGTESFTWLIVAEEEAMENDKKFSHLSLEEKLVYQTVKKSGNSGVWSKEIKNKVSGISSQAFEKILKKLSSLELIKSFKSVASKHKKMYILNELEPTSLIAGGSWHTDQEYDVDLISIITNYVLQVRFLLFF